MRLPDPSVIPAVIAGITLRRRRAGDDLPDDSPLAVIRHVRTHRDVPRDVLTEDLLDALTLICACEAGLAHDKHAVIRALRSLGVTWEQIRRPLGLRAYQAAEQTYLRLDHALSAPGAPRSEVAARQARRGGPDGKTAWLEQHAAQIQQAGHTAAQAAEGWPDAEFDVECLTDELTRRHPSPTGILAWIGALLYTVTANNTRPLPAGDAWREARDLLTQWDAVQ